MKDYPTHYIAKSTTNNNHQFSNSYQRTMSNDLDEDTLRFTIDNETRQNAYKDYIRQKSESIDANASNYLSFMSHNMNNGRRYNNYNKEQKNLISSAIQLTQQPDPSNRNYMPKERKILNSSFIPGFIKSKGSDITNLNYFTKQGNIKTYDMIKIKKREDLMYNQNIGFKLRNHHFEVSPNPYNVRSSEPLGTSSLLRNTILNPIPDLGYNRYLTKNTLIFAGKSVI